VTSTAVLALALTGLAVAGPRQDGPGGMAAAESAPFPVTIRVDARAAVAEWRPIWTTSM
jgi:hypothetical protein